MSVEDPRVPVLWLCGPPGVGKTTVAWRLFGDLTDAGVPVAYVDIDQLGICYPEPASDPARHLTKASNLGAVVTNFAAAGARCVVVSGVVDTARGVHREPLRHAALTVCRLRAEPDELRRRLLGRARPGDRVDAVLDEATALDGTTFADVCVDTTGHTVPDVVRLVRERAGGWPALTGNPAPASFPPPARDSVDVLLLCGVTGVGKSTVGWQVWQHFVQGGTRAGFVDLDQVGFIRPGPRNHRLRAHNLAAIWRTYHAVGARRLVVVGPVDDDQDAASYAEALPAANVTVFRLHAGRDQLDERIMLRGQGFGPDVPGDTLAGQPTEYLRRVADEAAAAAEALDRLGVGDVRVDTDGRSVDEVARTILTHATARVTPTPP